MKRFLLRTLARPGLLPFFRPLTRRGAVILTLHRFADPDCGIPGHDPAILSWALELLRRHRFNLIPLATLVDGLRTGRPPGPGTVCFTVDDGYDDFARIGAPVFARYDCPVTVFLVSGFLDGQCWLWWDQISSVLANSRRNSLSLDLSTGPWTASWSDTDSQLRAAEDLTERLKAVPTEERTRAIQRAAALLEVVLPERPPARFAPMSWDTVRACTARGVSFGAHTVTHPILARSTDSESRLEIEQSWRRVRSEVGDPCPVFCYPNGDPASFGRRECADAESLGLRGAVTTRPGIAGAEYFATDSGRARFALPRFAYQESADRFVQIVGGLEHVRATLRHNSVSRFSGP